ncbi:MAG: thiamine ABC transporter substrate-binding protein [Spirochaetaceae bacterium]|nr:MAG: thiamine ABC transporter substrate-binding protein [Spirochaetaceae bacterium]
MSGPGNSPASAAGREESTFAPIEERRGETDSLVIYGYDSLPGTLRRAIVAHFEEEYGVTVDLQRLGDTGAVYTQLFLERDDPGADVVIGLDSTFLPRLRADRILEPYEPSEISLAREELLVDPQFLAVPFDFGYITLNYDREELASPPGTWNDLLDPSLENSIIMLNPGTSSPGRNFLLFTIAEFGDGTDRLPGRMATLPGGRPADAPRDYLEFWRRLRPNVLTVTGGWSDGYGLYTQGEAPIVVSYETSPAFHRHYEETDRYGAILPDGGAYLQIEIAGIVRGAENRLNAERLIDYILSREFQELIALSQIMYPVHPDVELPEAFKSGPTVERALMLDNDLIAENFSRWLEAWEDVMR